MDRDDRERGMLAIERLRRQLAEPDHEPEGDDDGEPQAVAA